MCGRFDIHQSARPNKNFFAGSVSFWIGVASMW